MYSFFKSLMMAAAIVGLFATATVRADFRDYNSKAWAQHGRSSSGMMRRSQYRASAPVIVRSEQAPPAVAQTPSERRSFSYEPSMSNDNAPSSVRSDAAPRMRSTRPSRSSRTPAYLLPKTDPRKYRGL